MLADSKLPGGQFAMDGATELRDFSTTEKKSTALRVLVVDDEPLIRWSLTETLLDAGYEVLEAADGHGALDALKETPFRVDVVLLDLRLPDSTDLALLATLRRLSPKSQIILMTAYGTPEVAQGAMDLGAHAVVNKPLEMNDLSAMVERAYNSRRH
jgi:two-component system response regulator AtoC